MSLKSAIQQIDLLAVSKQWRFDKLAEEADLDPRRDFIGMDLRGADFKDANLDKFNFTLCDLRKTNITDASAPPQNVSLAITDITVVEKIGKRHLSATKRFIAEYLSITTAVQRSVRYIL